METDLLEIVELPDGEIALQRVDDEQAPLVKIRFSAESEFLLNNMKMEVARAMIEAGMHAYAELTGQGEEVEMDGQVIH